MLNVEGGHFRHCDGVSRRSFLKVGALGLGGLGLADVLRAESEAGIGSSRRAIIHVHLDGGPPQMDMIDPKPDSPVEYRGDIKPIRTTIPGLHISELMPKVAQSAHRFAFLRSLVGADGQHNAFQCQSGYKSSDPAPAGGWPAIGCVVSKLLENKTGGSSPAFIDLMQGRGLVRKYQSPAAPVPIS